MGFTMDTTTKFKLMTALGSIAILSSILLFGSAHASTPQGYLKVTSKAQKMIIINDHGKKTYKFVPATKVLPGEVIQYNTFFQNISNKPASNINIVNPIPKHTIYLANSAQGKDTITIFSVDGGKHYAKAGALRVRGTDGRLHLAKPSDYTHIRWEYIGILAPKTKQAVSFRVRLR